MTNELTTLNPAQLTIFTQETPKEAIRTRPGRGGRVLLYTDGAFVIRTLNEAFNWHWDFEVDHEEILYVGDRPFETRCRGQLIVWFGDTPVTKMQYGCQQVEMLKDGSAPVSLGDAFKGAATDALKKCASMLGIALDLYDSDSDVNTQNPQQIQREIQQAKQQSKQLPVVVETAKSKPIESTEPPKTNLDDIIDREFDRLVATPLPKMPAQMPPNSPQGLVDAVNSELTQSYYRDIGHAYGAFRKYLGLRSWPKPDDTKGWEAAKKGLLTYAREQILLDLAVTPVGE